MIFMCPSRQDGGFCRVGDALLYRGIVEEHEQTRTSGSLFDVSHMGRLYFSGAEAAAFLDRMLTRKVSDQQVGQSRYSLVCNEAGGVRMM